MKIRIASIARFWAFAVYLLSAGVTAMPMGSNHHDPLRAQPTISPLQRDRAIAVVQSESWHQIAEVLNAGRSHSAHGAGFGPTRVTSPRLLFGRDIRSRLVPSTPDVLPLRAERELRLSRE